MPTDRPVVRSSDDWVLFLNQIASPDVGGPRRPKERGSDGLFLLYSGDFSTIGTNDRQTDRQTEVGGRPHTSLLVRISVTGQTGEKAPALLGLLTVPVTATIIVNRSRAPQTEPSWATFRRLSI